MKPTRLSILVTVLLPTLGVTGAPPSVTSWRQARGSRPLTFEPNLGQAGEGVRFLAHASGGTLFLLDDRAVLAFPAGTGEDATADAITLRLPGRASTLSAADPQAARSHYLLGSDPAGWRRDVPHAGRVRYGAVAPGVDVVLYGTEDGLELDFRLAPGADASAAVLGVEGADAVELLDSGELALTRGVHRVSLRRPFVYQETAAGPRPVDGRYCHVDSRTVGFELGDHDPGLPLVIDPAIAFATYLGGSANEPEGSYVGIDVDAAGFVYVSGATTSANFPVLSPFQATRRGSRDVYVSKYDPTGRLVYSTFLGSTGTEDAGALRVTAAGNAYVTGFSEGLSGANAFPTTATAYSQSAQYSGLFLTVLDPSGGTLLYSTLIPNPTIFFGGGGRPKGMALDSQGRAVIAGNGFVPFTAGTIPKVPGSEGFVMKVDPSLAGASSLVLSAAVGDGCFACTTPVLAVDLDPSGNIWLGGKADSPAFPPPTNAFQASYAGNTDGFVLELDPTASAVLYGSYLGGGASDRVVAIATDAAGRAYVTGYTMDDSAFPVHFPTTPGAFQTARKGPGDAFVARVNAAAPGAASLDYSTLLGGADTRDSEYGWAIRADAAGSAYVTGWALSGFPLVSTLVPYGGVYDTFITKLNPQGTGLVFSTYLGGAQGGTGGHARAIAVDAAGNAYVHGITTAPDFPVTPGAQQKTFGGGFDAFVAKITGIPAAASGAFAVTAISPARGGDGGAVAVRLSGSGFQQGATVQLRRAGQADVPGSPVTFGSDVTLLAVFDLAGRQQGSWDVVVTNPGQLSAVLAGGFTVEPLSPPELWIQVTGQQIIGVHPRYTYTFAYGNRGNVDALLVPLTISGIPTEASWSLSTALQPPPPYPDLPDVPLAATPLSFTAGGQVYVPLLIPRVGAGETRVVRLLLNVPVDKVFDLTGTLFAPYLDAAPAFRPGGPGDGASSAVGGLARPGPSLALTQSQNCVLALWEATAAAVGSRVGPAGAYINDIFTNAAKATAQGDFSSTGFDIQGALGLLHDAGAFRQAVRRTGPASPDLGAEGLIPVLGNVLNAFKIGETLGTVLNACTDLDERLASALVRVSSATARDPNAKSGPAGSGAAGYVTGRDAFPYEIECENAPDVVAAAQFVTITDQIDLSRLDPSTFRLGPITFGGTTLTPPDGATSFAAQVDLRPARNLLVPVYAAFNPATGLLSASFGSLDPATGEPPLDPTLGVLPPNVTPPEGQAFLQFSIAPKPTLSTYDTVSNHARIVFDLNAPIDTAVVTNTIDKTKPASQVSPLAPTQATASFLVSWSATDAGSGVEGTSVYVSDGGGPYTAWKTNVTATSATFTGARGHAYAFFSRARDGVGNVEDAPGAPDATTQVSPSLLAGDVTADGFVDALDVTYLLAYLYSGGPAPPGSADCDGDGKVTSGDAVYLANHLFAGGPAPLSAIDGGGRR